MPRGKMNSCACGCGFLTKSTWAPGHDAKHKSVLLGRMRAGDESAMNELIQRGWMRTGEEGVKFGFMYRQGIELPPVLVRTEDEKVIEKVAKILALKANAGTEEEAQAAAAMAQKMAFKYNLDLEAIESGTKGVGRREVIRGTIDVGRAGWSRSLLSVVAMNNFCRVVTHGDSPICTVVGERHNLLITDYIYAFVVYEINRLADAAWTNRDRRAVYEPVQTYKRGFREGAVVGVSTALSRQRNDDMNNVQGGRALVIVKDQQVEEALHQFFPNLRAGRSRTVRYGQGYDLGYEKGRQIQINKGVGQARDKVAGRLAG